MDSPIQKQVETLVFSSKGCQADFKVKLLVVLQGIEAMRIHTFKMYLPLQMRLYFE